MNESLRTLLSGCIDYAGLFPPARLPLEQAGRYYAEGRRSSEAWMLGRFVCPAGRLVEMTSLLDEQPPAERPWRLSVLGRGGENPGEFLDNLATDLDEVGSFRATAGGRATIEAIELRLPDVPNQQAGRPGAGDSWWDSLFAGTAGRFDACDLSGIRVFFECAPTGDWRRVTAGVIDACAKLDQLSLSSGFKLRTGGPDASAFPAAQQVAFVMTTCRNAQLPWKATAGLHQPLTHFDNTLRTRVWGFLNILVADVLASVHRLSEEQVQRILEDEAAHHFRFDADCLSWRDLPATTAQVLHARQTGMMSFGSCRFDEPCDGLRRLSLL